MELFCRKRFVIIFISKRKMLKMTINSAYAVLETLTLVLERLKIVLRYPWKGYVLLLDICL